MLRNGLPGSWTELNRADGCDLFAGRGEIPKSSKRSDEMVQHKPHDGRIPRFQYAGGKQEKQGRQRAASSSAVAGPHYCERRRSSDFLSPGLVDRYAFAPCVLTLAATAAPALQQNWQKSWNRWLVLLIRGVCQMGQPLLVWRFCCASSAIGTGHTQPKSSNV